MNEKPAFIQGLFPYKGFGLSCPKPFEKPVAYTVPADKRSQTIYFRAGNPCEDLIYLILSRNSIPLRYFTVGAKAAMHVALAVVEDLSPGDRMEVLVAAPEGLKSSVVLDVGFMEIS